MYQGLTTDEVKEALQKYGYNEIPKVPYRSLKIFLRQFRSVFILLLVGASAITFFLGEPFDAGFILLFVLLGVSLSFYQEYKSNQAVDKLKSLLVNTITTRRNNQDQETPVIDLVPGDILKLETGDVIPADAVLVYAHDFLVDETTFTGESLPVVKMVNEAVDAEKTKLFQGTVVVRGLAYAVVESTGNRTRLARIAKVASAIDNVSDLTKGVSRLSTFILKATFITLFFVVGANFLIEGNEADLPHLLIFAIALAISVIPEALPLVMTFSLSRAALRLAKRHVLVKRLSSVQDLGSIELLCTDKTGTITENKLMYKNEYIIPESPWHPLVLTALSAHDLDKGHVEPFDQATSEALSVEMKCIVSEFELIEEEPFSPSLRSNGAWVRDRSGQTVHVRRGSPEYFIEQGIVALDRVSEWLRDEEEKGHRVLGVSYDYGQGVRFGGFVSFADTLKKTTANTLAEARALNIAVTIITGDSLRVARAIGKEVSLVTEDTEVIEAKDFFALPNQEQIELLAKIRVFARTTPEQKLALITMLREKLTVGFLGEGINDVAALKASSVSLVVQSASDVARETSDIVLLKSDLGVIIDGIRLGRETHANTLKYIRATLISNFGNFYAVATASLFITFLPMLPKQLLLLNLLSDFPMMAIAFDRVSRAEITQPQKYDFRSLYIIFITLGLVSTVFDFMWFALFYTEGPAVLQTNWFIASVITEILLLLSIRSLLPIEKSGWPAPIIIWLSVLALVCAMVLPVWSVSAHYFSFAIPSLADLGIISGLAVLYLVVTELVKRPLVRFLRPGKNT